MKHCGEILSREISRKKVLRKNVAEYIGVTPQYMNRLLSKSSLDSDMLEKFCEYLDLDPADFFDFRGSGNESLLNVGDIDQHVVFGSAAVNFSVSERNLMERLLAEKDARINDLRRTIDSLSGVGPAVLSSETESM